MEAFTRWSGLAALLAGEVGALRLLHRLGELPWLAVGWDDPAAWLAVVPAEDAVMAALRVVALAGAYWLVITTGCYTLARAARLPAAARSVGWATLPVVRRLADRAVAVALAGSTVTLGVPGLATATIVAPPAVTAPADLPGEPAVEQGGSRGDPPPWAGPGDGTRETVGAEPGGTGPAGTPAAYHVVAPGENLWAITAASLGGSPSNAEIHPRWQDVVAANRDRLRSGDPDLIHPGEEVLLPPSSPSP
ncbi:MAG TPA: hypothetical protein VM324_15890 [Egibacteraceae bacterium]|nr:hypothetical protein [Egibacteraceae bacterium]